MVEAVAEVIDDLPGTKVYVQGCPKDKLPKDFESFHDVMEEMSCDNVDSDVRKDIKFYDPAVYIYTSGTTGGLISVHVTDMCRYVSHLDSLSRDMTKLTK